MIVTERETCILTHIHKYVIILETEREREGESERERKTEKEREIEREEASERGNEGEINRYPRTTKKKKRVMVTDAT